MFGRWNIERVMKIFHKKCWDFYRVTMCAWSTSFLLVLYHVLWTFRSSLPGTLASSCSLAPSPSLKLTKVWNLILPPPTPLLFSDMVTYVAPSGQCSSAMHFIKGLALPFLLQVKMLLLCGDRRLGRVSCDVGWVTMPWMQATDIAVGGQLPCHTEFYRPSGNVGNCVEEIGNTN